MKKKFLFVLLFFLITFFSCERNVIAEEVSNQNNIQNEQILANDNEVDFSNIEKWLIRGAIIAVILTVILVILFLTDVLDDVIWFFEDIFIFLKGKIFGLDFYDYKYEIFNKELTSEYIHHILSNSNKIFSEEDKKYLLSFVQDKNEWKMLKKDISSKIVDENEEKFIKLFLDTLQHIDIIANFFKKEKIFNEISWKCMIEDNFSSFIRYENYFIHTKKHYFITEIAVYILTNKELKIKDFYNFLIIDEDKEEKRINSLCMIADLVENELSFQESSNSIENIDDAVALMNEIYDLNISNEFAYNLIHFSKVEYSDDLYQEAFQKNVFKAIKYGKF